VRCFELLDSELRDLEPLDARAVQLLTSAEERDRVVDCHVASFEPRHDVLELSLELLEPSLFAHGRTSSTVA